MDRYHILWSNQEKNILRKAYKKYLLGDLSFDDILKLLPSRSGDSIKKKATSLKLHRTVYGEVNTNYIKELKKRGITL